KHTPSSTPRLSPHHSEGPGITPSPSAMPKEAPLPEFTPGGIQFALADDKIKDGASPSALADNFKTLALTADAHANDVAEVARASAVSTAATDATTKADNAKTDAIADATTKYGGLPARVSAVEAKNTAQDIA